VTDLLSAARQRRVTLVVAGAGYGKTTALAEIAATGQSRWVRVKPADAQAESLSARIAAALGESPSPDRSAIAAATGSDDRQLRLRRHGQARRNYADYARRMGELDVVPVALADAGSWRP
jgi:ATP/maltotriose-dependent transcriptional regulator MalT